MQRKRILALFAVMALLCISATASTAMAFDFDPGDGGTVYPYADITIKYQRLRCMEDTDNMALKGLAGKGADVWMKLVSNNGLGTFKKDTVVKDFIEGFEGNLAGIVPGSQPEKELTHTSWGGYLSITFNDVYVASSDKTFNLYIYDRDLLGINQELVEGKLTIKKGMGAGTITRNNIYAYSTYYSNYWGTGYDSHNYDDSYVKYEWKDGPYFTWGSNGAYSGESNRLYIDVIISYHA